MKMKTLSVLAGVGAPLIATASASAAFLGLKAVSKPNSFGLIVVSVYAEFDRPGEDFMRAVAGTANSPMLIQVLGGGTFYNHAFGSDTAPHGALIAAFPSLAFDTFVTVGARQFTPTLPDATVMTPGFPPLTGTQLFTTASGWAVTPIDPQGDPFNTDYSSGNGQILLGQFATADGTGFNGTWAMRYQSSGQSAQSFQSFVYIVPAPGAVGLLGMAALFGARCRRRLSGHSRTRA